MNRFVPFVSAVFAALLLNGVCGVAVASPTAENVLILVNEDSATSVYIAKMYRQYYPQIEDWQVLNLSGLADCSGPTATAADEILSRANYNSNIANPVRQYLLDDNYPERFEKIMIIVTTAGIPYRIEDTVYADVVYPSGSSGSAVSLHTSQIDAASVESELTCLLYTDDFGLDNRMANPYQGYRNSSITLFERLIPGTKTKIWNSATAIGGVAPKMEGFIDFTSWPPNYGTIYRNFGPGDMYLTCRLDGAKSQGESAVFTVRKVLERSRRASDPSWGVNAQSSAVVIDDAPNKHLDRNRVYNLDSSMNYYTYSPETPQPPDAPSILTQDDYTTAYEFTTQDSYQDNLINVSSMDLAYDMKVIFDRRLGYRTSQGDLTAQETAAFFCCYGKNGDESSSSDYITNGFNNGPLFKLSNGAVFTSFESFNALTMFSDLHTAPVAQGKIIDFIAIGGSGTVGHAFEPMSSAAVDNAFLLYGLYADTDMDSRADLTFIEAVFTGIPFLSWSEVAVGDPLMRIAYGPGGSAWNPLIGDVNRDGRVNFFDLWIIKKKMGGTFDLSSPDFDKYSDLCDQNKDGVIDSDDIQITLQNLGASN